MAAKLVILVAALSACQAVPAWIGQYPNAVFRDSRSPNVAFGFGGGFSSDIGGIRQSNSYGTAFQSGNAEAYGAGFAGRDYASGVGQANAPAHVVVSHPVSHPVSHIVSKPVSTSVSHPVSHQVSHPVSHQVSHPVSHQVSQPVSHQVSHPVSHQHATSGVTHHNYAVPVQNFGSAVSTAHSHNGLGSASSSVLNGEFGRYPSAVSSAQNYGLGYESAVASANANGLGQASAVSSAQNVGNFGSALSSAQSLNGYNNYGASVAAAENIGNYKASTAHTIQQNGGRIQESGATSVNAPGVQAANSHAVNFY
ncbi:unnamed protein product, partial [Iphiclides podalirius]